VHGDGFSLMKTGGFHAPSQDAGLPPIRFTSTWFTSIRFTPGRALCGPPGPLLFTVKTRLKGFDGFAANLMQAAMGKLIMRVHFRSTD